MPYPPSAGYGRCAGPYRLRRGLGAGAGAAASLAPSSAPPPWRGDDFLLSLGSGASDAAQRRQRRASLLVSLALQAVLVTLMLTALAVGPRLVVGPRLDPADHFIPLLLPARVQPRVRVRAPRTPAPLPPLRRLARVAPPPRPPAPRPLPARAAASRLAAPQQLTPQAHALALLPPPPVAPPPRPQLGSFGAPRGITAVAGTPLPLPQLGQFGTAAAPAQAQAATGAVQAAGFDPTAAAGGAPAGSIHGAGFDRSPAAPGADANPAPVRLHQFANLAPTVAAEVPQPPPALAAAFQPPQILSWPTPVYTALAAAHRREGEVVLELRLGANGAVAIVQVVRSLGDGLDESAAAAARQLRFRPARRRGQAVDWTVYLHVQFRVAN